MNEPASDMPEREALAAEYVLGTLALPERLAAEALVDSDTNFARLVDEWRDRLSPLNAGYAPVTPPPGLLEAVEKRLFPEPEAPHRRPWLWGVLAAAALAALALVTVLPTARPPAAIVVTLTGENQPLVIDARFDPEAGELTITRSAGPAAAPGQDHELWLIPEGEAPISIGLVREGDLTIPIATLPAGTTLAVTLEAEGGAPTGAATGTPLVSALIGGS
ncbi:anti-sigma factor [Defluviimonas salinarum]|uniref:Anti-sigma factor n=1 Tax=Defluviimonas salinarum TaxID=2992147 RepID=A0ABT3IZF5_9RHOB|nr:anti-sigma factor [Defluviimonas salinarum]MCW3780826.1 anti-sigma factor [Defluviimonas salinarum]